MNIFVTWKRVYCAALLVLLLLSIPLQPGLAAEPALLQTTAVYGVIATDPLYLWIAPGQGDFSEERP